MLQKFVYITGALDFLVGAAAIGGALAKPIPGGFVPVMTLGAFLMMAAACLMWASKDMVNRHPVIFWQGIVRLVAASSVAYAVPNGLSQNWEFSLVFFDGIIGVVYIGGMLKVTGLGIGGLLMCRPAQQS